MAEKRGGMTVSECSKLCSHHIFELHSDGMYHCDCGALAGRINGPNNHPNATWVDGQQCSVCKSVWCADQQKPCDCEPPVVYTTAQWTSWTGEVSPVACPPSD